VAQNTPIVSVISDADLEIEANVPEVDIGKLNPGNPVSITFDAFPNETFSGSISYIDPAETIIDGVVNFKITIAFAAPSGSVRSGLTANLAIESARKDDVLFLPQFAIIEDSRGAFVQKVINDVIQEIPVTTGLRGHDGNVEIVSGVLESDSVVNIAAK
jgi:HlyD family secretion protein